MISNLKTWVKSFSGQRGFTLIELLVVIAIIGILSSVVLASLNSARSKARDTTRKQNIDQLVKAINLYYNQNGTLPGTNVCHTVTNGGVNLTQFTNHLVPTFIKELPKDPTITGINAGNYVYQKISNTSGQFLVCALMENASAGNMSPVVDLTACTGGVANYNYCVSQ